MERHVVRVPDVGEGIAEVELVGWSVAVGDTVERNQVLAEVMTDKANVEIPSPVDGVIASLNGTPGDTMSVGLDLIELSVASDDQASPPPPTTTTAPPLASAAPAVDSASASHGAASSAAHADTVATQGPAATAVTTPTVASSTSIGSPLRPLTPEQRDRGVTLPFPQPRHKRSEQPTSAVAAPAPAPAAISASVAVEWAPPDTGRIGAERPRAAPAVRHRATNLGIDLATVEGTGPGGRITHSDLDRHLLAAGRLAAAPSVPPPARGSAAPPPSAPEVGSEPLIGVRRRIARRMVEATTTIPHITYVEEVDVTAVEELRASLNADAEPGTARLTLLPFLIRALAVVLPDHPSCNAHLVDADASDDGAQPGDGTLLVHREFHVGIATQTDRGLMVPVINEADTLDLHTLATRVATAAERARDGSAAPAEFSGSTITITSLGALGGLATTPVINKPEVAIVGVNKIATRPVWRDGAVVPRKIMHLSSSFDHRVIDGWVAAQFVQGLRRALEQPALLFIDR